MGGLANQPDLSVVGGFGSANAMAELERLAPSADVLVDFTTGRAAAEILLTAVGHGLHVVSGTSGLPDTTLDQVDKAGARSGQIPAHGADYASGDRPVEAEGIADGHDQLAGPQLILSKVGHGQVPGADAQHRQERSAR